MNMQNSSYKFLPANQRPSSNWLSYKWSYKQTVAYKLTFSKQSCKTWFSPEETVTTGPVFDSSQKLNT